MDEIISKKVHITGLVQGVGFRPFVYRMAIINQVKGWVENGNDGVRIHAEALASNMETFLNALKNEAPAASQIKEMIMITAKVENHALFHIRHSADYSDEITEISPDIAVCDECLADIETQPHRLNYPFINCTNCGPRFTIITDLPYDRPKTTMAHFVMCGKCQAEYSNVLDRRFHAQPIACLDCGPHYELIAGDRSVRELDDILSNVAWMLGSGKILAIKGMGGFHLACDATNEAAVARLRASKNREGKPFAVMFRTLEDARGYLQINEIEEEELVSWRRPVVILENRQAGSKLAESVSNGFTTTGAMLPYMPIHHLLFKQLHTPAIVLTSGNFSDEPIIIDNETALEQFHDIADGILVYNRDIHNRTDDSVVMVAGRQSSIIRRSRGYAPAPLHLSLPVEGIFAAGAELVNCFCIGKGNQAIMSQHIGDLKNLETLEFYKESFQRYRRMFRQTPDLIACDLHPDYLSTRFALEFAEEYGLPVVKIQHHHAHIAACMAEHGLDEPVIGISMDGVGLGTDGHVWGFEGMICDLPGFERKFHLAYIPQPGGDLATRQPWRMALAYLHRYAPETLKKADLPFFHRLTADQVRFVTMAIENNINTPLTSSAGRLFDAVAAMTGVCLESSFHAEAPMRLENIADWNSTGRYQFQLHHGQIHPEDVIEGIIRDLRNGIHASVISARFHRGVAETVVDVAKKIRDASGLNKVVLSGGSYQNRFLLINSEKLLNDHGFDVCLPSCFPANDGGIALGQLIIAAKRRQAGKI